MNITTLLKALDAVGPVVARIPEFIDLYHSAVAVLNVDDQPMAQAALADIQADNDEGHRRLQQKLQIAARQE